MIDLIVRAINEGKVQVRDDEMVVLRSGDHTAAHWHHIAKALQKKFPRVLVISLPRNSTLEVLKKRDVAEILQAIKDTP